MEQTDRWWVASAWLWVMVVANSLTIILQSLFLYFGGLVGLTRTPIAAQIYFVAASAIQLVCVWAIFHWRKWGWRLLLIVAGANYAVNIASGHSPVLCLVGLLGPAITFWVLRGGGDLAAWPRLK